MLERMVVGANVGRWTVNIRKNTCAFSGTYRTLKSKKRFISENKAYKSKSTWDFFMPGRVA